MRQPAPERQQRRQRSVPTTQQPPAMLLDNAGGLTEEQLQAAQPLPAEQRVRSSTLARQSLVSLISLIGVNTSATIV